jgi:signal transduction histidine kinase
MKLLTKGLLLIALPGVIELALFAAVFDTQKETARSAQWAADSKQILYQASSMMNPLLREAARVRTAIVVRDASFIDRRAIWVDVSDRLTRLEQLVADNPQQVRRVHDMRAAVDSYRAHAAAVVQALHDGRNLAPFIAVERTDISGPIAAFHNRLDAFVEEESRLDADRLTALAKNRQRQQITLIAAVIGSMLIWAATALVLARHFGRRVEVLTGNAERLGRGELLAAPLTGDDEIAALDAVLHQTGARLRTAEQEHATLKARLQARAAELAVVNEELRQGTQENEMFIYSVSHDLRSPLVNLQGFSKELQVSCDDLRATIESADLPPHERHRLKAVLDGDVRESLRFLRTSVTRAAAIIEALLRISRAGRLEYQWQRVSVGRTVARVVDALQGETRERAAVVTVRELPPVWGDPAAIEQIFSNLIANALNYLDPMRPGQIEVGALEPAPADEAHPLANSTRTYYVRDNGLGISAAYMSKVFRAFQRLHGDVAKGEGIGLALVRRIAERHGGRVWVESTEGVGSTFFVTLPEQPAHMS